MAHENSYTIMYFTHFLHYSSTRMSNNDFKGKVYYYSNINGQENTIEKEFDTQEDMNEYLQKNDTTMPRFMNPTPRISWFAPWFDEFFDQRMHRLWLTPRQNALDYDPTLNELEKRKAEIEAKEEREKEEKSFLEKRRDERKKLVDFFKKRDDKSAVEKAQDGLKKVEEKLKNLAR